MEIPIPPEEQRKPLSVPIKPTAHAVPVIQKQNPETTRRYFLIGIVSYIISLSLPFFSGRGIIIDPIFGNSITPVLFFVPFLLQIGIVYLSSKLLRIATRSWASAVCVVGVSSLSRCLYLLSLNPAKDLLLPFVSVLTVVLGAFLFIFAAKKVYEISWGKSVLLFLLQVGIVLLIAALFFGLIFGILFHHRGSWM